MVQNDLSVSNMNENRSFTPGKSTGPGSPTASARTHPSTINLQDGSRLDTQPFSPLPNAAMARESPRMNPSYSANDIASMQNASPAMALPPRSASMMFIHGSGPQSQGVPPQLTMGGQSAMRMDTIVSTPLDGSEPKIFPGVVSRRRKNSAQSFDTGAAGSPGRSRRLDVDGAPGPVVEEPEDLTDDDDDDE
jgi:AMP deaminase